MQVQAFLGTFLLIYSSCNAYVHNPKYVSSENMTIFDILFKMASLDDLIVQSISDGERGDLERVVGEIKCVN